MVNVPATIMRSDCLGLALGAVPSLSRSYLGIDVCIISTAQQASPKVIQCKEPVLAQLMTSSVDVTKNPLSCRSLLRAFTVTSLSAPAMFTDGSNPILKRPSSIRKQIQSLAPQGTPSLTKTQQAQYL